MSNYVANSMNGEKSNTMQCTRELQALTAAVE
jgi:hypothetical protein